YRLDKLSLAIDAPLATLDELVEMFVARGILARATEPEGVVLSRPPEQLRVVEVLDVIRDPGSLDSQTPETGATAVSDVLRKRDEALRDALGGVTLRSLVDEASSQEAVVADL